ncbi:hypothetical protein JCM11641_003145 [Rhodosporidiobolus odoratus]
MTGLLDIVPAGVVAGKDLIKLFDHARDNHYAIPAFNVTSSSTAIAALEGARDSKSPVILQVSQGGAAMFAGKGIKNDQQQASIAGAVSAAHYIRAIAPTYGIPVVLHSDHCAKKLLPWFDGMLDADEAYYKKEGVPLFSSHMLDLSEESKEENIETCVKYFKRMAKIELWLEMEIGITGGEEDGVDNTGVDNASLYTQPEDILDIHNALHPISPAFSIAAGFGNVHGVYKPGNVKLRPELLQQHQEHAHKVLKSENSLPIYLVFHGGSGSSKEEITTAVKNGVVKMNVDTDTQWAYMTGFRDYFLSKADYLKQQVGNPEGESKPNKKYADPRIWVREGELTMKARVQEALKDQIHAELLAAQLIPDPFLQRNEELVQWVGETDWIHQCDFKLSPVDRLREGEMAELVFEGLDTFADVYLNDEKLASTDNMHREYRIPATSALREGRNLLKLVFHSAFRRGRELERKYLGPDKHWPCWNGDPSRLFVRKAGYGYGWDWGPVLMTAGPYRPIRLEIFRSRIRNFWPQAAVNDKLETSLSLSWEIASPVDFKGSLSVRARLLHPHGRKVRQVSLEATPQANEHVWRFEEDEVGLWWTKALGNQPLYAVEVDLVDNNTGAILHTVSRKIGFRRLRVLREPLIEQPGRTFLFELNNVPLFIGGSNWIPIDSVLTNANEARYRKWLELAVEGNQNMVRVWGGGVYEPDCFYEICDELGLLVWQDFMFACGAYPAHAKDFRENVELEVEGVAKRVRHHPSLAIFAGNNEDYQIAESEGLEYDPEDTEGVWLNTSFPARELYERTFPRIVKAHSDTFYWPGSPWGGKKTTDQTEGDLHCWSVWHGAQEPYQKYGELGGRFVSEFGMQAAPDVRTVDYFLDGDTSERFPQSCTLDAHNKASGFARRLACYFTENIRIGTLLEDYVYSTQLIQSEALSTAFSAWRRKFRGGIDGAYCAGALVWQLNDVWPCTSWSIVDYFLRPKPAYFSIKRALAPFCMGARRYTEKTFPDPLSAAHFVEKAYVDVWAGNSSLSDEEVEVDIEAFGLLTGARVYHEQLMVTLKASQSTELKVMEIPIAWNDVKNAVVVVARLRSARTKEGISRVSVWPEPFKYLTFPSASSVDLRICLDCKTGTLTASSQRPVKGLVFTFSTDVKVIDNALDLIPGEEQIVQIKGSKKETKVTWRYLGDVV